MKDLTNKTSTQDPYEPPAAAGVANHRSFTQTPTGWVVVFVLNLPIPLFCANVVVKGPAGTGLALAVALLLASGALVCELFPKLVHPVIVGGVVTAILQLFPILQMLVGEIAIAIASQSGLTVTSAVGGVKLVDSFFAGFFVTTLTANIMLAVAYALGRLLVGRTPIGDW